MNAAVRNNSAKADRGFTRIDTAAAKFDKVESCRSMSNGILRELVRRKKQLAPNFQLERLPFYCALKRAFTRRMRQSHVQINGFVIHVDPLDSLELSLFGVYEPFQSSLVERAVKPGMTVVDIGANIGYYSLLFGRLCGPEGVVHAFEPAPENLRLLQHNLVVNNISNVRAYDCALGDQPGTALLRLSAENLGDHSFFATDHQRAAVEVKVMRLDDILSGPVDVIKIDIQGAEARAIAGMRQTFRRSTNLTLFTEFCPKGLADAGSGGEEYLALLRQCGFQIFEIDEYARRVRPLQEHYLQRKLTPENGRHTNLLCRKGDS